jgi:hypothetical protein
MVFLTLIQELFNSMCRHRSSFNPSAYSLKPKLLTVFPSLLTGQARRTVSVIGNQFCSCLGGFGNNRRDGLELAIQFLYESALFRRARSSKCFGLAACTCCHIASARISNHPPMASPRSLLKRYRAINAGPWGFPADVMWPMSRR